MGATGSWAMEGSMTEFRTLRAGIFLPPFHPNDEDPLLCMERDFELMQWLDKLDFAEAWIGEHHSGGDENYGHPGVVLATAAPRPPHHPARPRGTPPAPPPPPLGADPTPPPRHHHPRG